MADSIRTDFSLVEPSVKEVVSVFAWPDEVSVAVHTLDGNLTIEQAEALVELLQGAIAQARVLDWDEATESLVLRG